MKRMIGLGCGVLIISILSICGLDCESNGARPVGDSQQPISHSHDNEASPQQSVTNSDRDQILRRREGNMIPTRTREVLGCTDLKDLEFAIVEDVERKAENINLVVNGEKKQTIRLPNDSEIWGFGFDGVTKTDNGFEISVQYGSRIYFEKVFVFTCFESTFALERIRTQSFDKAEPSKLRKKVMKVRPPISVDSFSIVEFLHGSE